ncbi:MAG: hypothetical protein ACRDOU_16620 [Streptosporangiaceae bacterium]
MGGAIGVAVASTVAATHSRLLLSQGHPAAALTAGFQWALWVSGLTGLAAVPATLPAHPAQRTGPGRGDLHADRAPRDRNHPLICVRRPLSCRNPAGP